MCAAAMPPLFAVPRGGRCRAGPAWAGYRMLPWLYTHAEPLLFFLSRDLNKGFALVGLIEGAIEGYLLILLILVAITGCTIVVSVAPILVVASYFGGAS